MTIEVQRQVQRVMGPVDYLVVLFPGNKFKGEIAPEIKKLEDAKIVRVIDVVFIRKDERGNVDSLEIEEMDSATAKAFENFKGRIGRWLSEADVLSIGEAMPNNSSAGALLFENLWAIGVKEAMLRAGGELLAQGRIPPELIEKVQEGSAQ